MNPGRTRIKRRTFGRLTRCGYFQYKITQQVQRRVTARKIKTDRVETKIKVDFVRVQPRNTDGIGRNDMSSDTSGRRRILFYDPFFRGQSVKSVYPRLNYN